MDSEDNNNHSTQSIAIKEVIIDGLAILKIIKHCNDNFPTLVAGSLLGLDIKNTLEVTYTYPFPIIQSKSEQQQQQAQLDSNENPITTTATDRDDNTYIDGGEYQYEMLKMLSKMNYDNNCIGWYTSCYYNSIYNMETISTQFTYQSAEELTENCVLIMYDPILSIKNNNVIIKAYRLSDLFIEMRKNKLNEYIKPTDILVEIPILIKNSGHIAAYLMYLNDTDTDITSTGANSSINSSIYDSLLLSNTESVAEKNIELIGIYTDVYSLYYAYTMHMHVHILMYTLICTDTLRICNVYLY